MSCLLGCCARCRSERFLGELLHLVVNGISQTAPGNHCPPRGGSRRCNAILERGGVRVDDLAGGLRSKGLKRCGNKLARRAASASIVFVLCHPQPPQPARHRPWHSRDLPARHRPRRRHLAFWAEYGRQATTPNKHLAHRAEFLARRAHCFQEHDRAAPGSPDSLGNMAGTTGQDRGKNQFIHVIAAER